MDESDAVLSSQLMKYGAQDCLVKKFITSSNISRAIINAYERHKVNKKLRSLHHELSDSKGKLQKEITEREKLDEALKKAYDKLENKVIERTTELHQANENLRKSEARLSKAQRIAHFGSWEWDIADNTMSWSDEIYRIFGMESAKLTATYETFMSFVHPDDRAFVQQSINDAIYKKEKYNIDHRIILPTGEERFVNKQAEVTFDENAKAIYMSGTIHDITGRKQLEQTIIEKNQVESANVAKSEFLANLTHDIRTPLGAILGFNQILLERGKKLDLPEDFREFQENIQTSAQNLLDMINNFLDISKIESGKISIIEEDFNIKDLIKNVFHITEMLAHKKGVIYSYDISSELPSVICSDRSKLIQILMNLVGNAIKFTPSGKEIKLKVTGGEKAITFEVIDHGIGIPEERQNAIFRVFEQANESTSVNYGGTGLGLAITKKLVEMLGGNISLFSQVGEGSTFKVTILHMGASESVADQEEIGLEVHEFSKDNVILVIEDNLMNQVLIEALFEDLGLEVYLVNNGKLGVEKTIELMAENSPPDLIFMDMQMPVMNGIEATQQIRSNSDLQDIPIIALSADGFSEQKTKALSFGINDYLTKPIEMDKLMPILKKYLRQDHK
jgi:PAS domain S-box-containing protein